MKPPPQSLYLLVDSVDEGCNVVEGEQTSPSLSGTVAELLAGHHEFFPPWLLLLCSARKQSRAVTKMFSGECCVLDTELDQERFLLVNKYLDRDLSATEAFSASRHPCTLRSYLK